MVEMRNVYIMLAGKPERKRPLGRHRHRWNNNIKMNLKEIRFEVWTVFIQLKTGGSGGLL
jgi:hypothetical protein